MPGEYRNTYVSPEQAAAIKAKVLQFNQVLKASGSPMWLNYETIIDRTLSKRGFERTLKRLNRIINAQKNGKLDRELKKFSQEAARTITKRREKLHKMAKKAGLEKYGEILRFENFQPKENLYGKLPPDAQRVWLSSMFYEQQGDYLEWRARKYKASLQASLIYHWQGRIPEPYYSQLMSIFTKTSATKLFNAFFQNKITNITYNYDIVYGMNMDIEDVKKLISEWKRAIHGK